MARAAYKTAPDPNETGWPAGVRYIIGNEGCERFSYYGMRAILYIYIAGLYIQLRGMDEETAKAAATGTYHLFAGGVYALPLIGAIIADRLLGKYRTIIWLSLVYCAGHACLALFESPALQQELFGTTYIDPIQGLYLGLALIALGSGGIKPCVSANVGDQFGKGNWHLLQKVFNAFYFIINFGSAFATIFIPMIRGNQTVDPVTGFYVYDGSVSWAFAVPGLLMGLATIFFWMGRKEFVHVPASPGGKLGGLDALAGTFLFMVIGWPIFFNSYTTTGETLIVSACCLLAFALVFSYRQSLKADDGFLAMMFFSCGAWLKRCMGKAGDFTPVKDSDRLEDHWFFGPAARRFGADLAEGPLAVLKIISVFFLVSVFWALFDQHGSTWIEQARGMDRMIELTATGWIGVGVLLGALVAGAIALTISEETAKRLKITGIGVVVGLGLGFMLSSVGAFEVQPSQVPALNPFMVMILIPYTTFGLYPLLRKLGWDPHPLRRMTLGMLMASVSFVAVALIQVSMESTAETGETVHVVWQLIPYLVITLAEVMVSITGLEFAYSQAPNRMKSVIMGFFLFNVTLGNLLVVFVAYLPDMTTINFFWTFAALMAVAGILFGVRAMFYEYKDYSQDSDSSSDDAAEAAGA